MRTPWQTPVVMVVVALLSSTDLEAQFPGDVFFDPPTLVASPSGELEVTLQTFVGSQRLGALVADVTFADTDAEYLGFLPVDPEYDAGVKVARITGGLRVTVVKDARVLGRIGTVSLTTLRFRALAATGTSFTLGCQVVQTLDVDFNAYPSSTGFSAEVSVGTTALTANAGTGQPPGSTTTSWSTIGRGAPLRPLGATVPTYAMNWWTRTWQRILIATRDPAAPRDR